MCANKRHLVRGAYTATRGRLMRHSVIGCTVHADSVFMQVRVESVTESTHANSRFVDEHTAFVVQHGGCRPITAVTHRIDQSVVRIDVDGRRTLAVPAV